MRILRRNLMNFHCKTSADSRRILLLPTKVAMGSTLLHLSVVVLFFIQVHVIPAYRILVLLPVASRSHKNVFDPLIRELANQNHQLTVFSPFKLTPEEENVEDVIIEDRFMANSTKKLFENSALSFLFGLKETMVSSCTNFLKNPKTQELLAAGKKFDAVIVNAYVNECALMIAQLVSEKTILLCPAGVILTAHDTVPFPPSFVPNQLLPYMDQMSFLQRMFNFLSFIGGYIVFVLYLQAEIEAVVIKQVPEAPSIADALKNVSLVLTNTDPVLLTPRPLMSNIINVGGMHCRDAKPVPKDFEDFIQSSGEDGFIVVSLGSIAQSRFLPPETKEIFIKSFARLKQKVIWKYEEKLDKTPINLKVTPWLPQQDLLGHSKCRLFITHGGLLSLQETLYHGIPVIGIPIFADQPANIERVQSLHFGERINLNNITEDIIYETVQKILADKRYKDNVNKYSAIFRDRPQQPLKLASTWVEYAIRHHLTSDLSSSCRHLDLVQYLLFDQLIVIFILLLSFAWTVKKVTILIYSKVK